MTALKVAGLTPLTTIDYPGHLAAVIFCQGCPWRCRYCHNPELQSFKKEGTLTWTQIISWLEKRKDLLDAVVFSGGEPTAQKELPSAIKAVKEMGFKIGIHTAGMYPHKLKEILPMVDWVGLDIKAPQYLYDKITGRKNSSNNVWQSLELLNTSNIEYQVRITKAEQLQKTDIHYLRTQLEKNRVKNIVEQNLFSTY
ncbi:anaerobic ribonucleoside-triphosphate reductase activating protein [Teredinibacter sp. KSP-S5-2]|uniref:anaerobic ribonucleoside-triphosphate reductase activating protein n=1 Tax=Teredinibacter sp. KSP-S5-2 TaxID=3034506 RepID=UPI00293515E2|nr:anaerobic ribonucleoside-triphosphate reductase activating protein [Teredinibacter sp. KSP-S5-2]WNO08540.1 anaerobic ribonucleoside-triphosphate reductase activating protein [Teredinibacter sp. KSP-S5-2]